ncbi:MAG: YhjD/YihY/BrkB family envelope integrity protein, partial [Cruoricaptor ignavus]|nr:YhjD/YihY/BrkB family envelope integrity protein [Cruoricaptor ignavus]
MKHLKFTIDVLKDTAKAWSSSNVFKDSAAMAYYALFSIPGLLIIVIWLAGYFFGAEAIQGEISAKISGIMGNEIANSIEGFIASATIDEDSGIMKAIGIGSLVFGSTTLFFQLQKSLNEIWNIETAPNKALMGFLLARFNSLGLIFVIGFLMMITMLLSSMIALA